MQGSLTRRQRHRAPQEEVGVEAAEDIGPGGAAGGERSSLAVSWSVRSLSAGSFVGFRCISFLLNMHVGFLTFWSEQARCREMIHEIERRHLSCLTLITASRPAACSGPPPGQPQMRVRPRA